MNDYQLTKRALFFFCSFELGGAERQGLHLAKFLQGLGWFVKIYSLDTCSGPVVAECEEAGLQWGVQRFRWPCRKISLIKNGYGMLRTIRQDRASVVFGYTTWPNVGCGLSWRLAGAKAFIWGQRNVHLLTGDSIERIAYRQASAVICNANHQVDFLEKKLGKTSAPIHVVHNGFDPVPPAASRSQWRDEMRIERETCVVTMVANFRTVKDHYTLLRAWQLVVSSFPVNEQPVLCLAGAPQETYETTKRLARKLAISDNIRFLGQVKDVSGLLEASDIGVLTSEREGLPNAIVEYMAAGLAIVASDIAGNREVLGIENADLYFSVGNVTSLAERISALVRSKAKRSDQAIVHRERVRAAFSLETLCNRTLHIVEDCLAERSERRVKVQ